MTAAAAAALPSVCLLYTDSNFNSAFGLFETKTGAVKELLELDWAGMPEGIDAAGAVVGQQRFFYNVGIGEGAQVKDVAAVISWVPELQRATVTYADLPAAMPPSASRFGGSVAFANQVFDPSNPIAPLLGIMQPDSGDETWLAAGQWSPFDGVITDVYGNFTAIWAGDDAYKYGCAAFDPTTRTLFQCVGTTGPSEAVQAITIPRMGAGPGPYTPIRLSGSIPLPTGTDILSVSWSASLNATVLLTGPLAGRARSPRRRLAAAAGAASEAARGAGGTERKTAAAAQQSTVWVQHGSIYKAVYSYDSSLIASILGGSTLSQDGRILVSILNAPDSACTAVAGCAVISYVDVSAGIELARVPLANVTTLVADVQLCLGVTLPS